MVVAAMLVAACQSGVAVHDDASDGAGPLSASSGFGSFAMTDPPGVKSHWYASFGSYDLCVTEPGARTELTGVTWEAADEARPLAVTPWLRMVDRTTKPTGGFVGVVGLPWKPVEDEPYPGEYTKKIAGTVITQACANLNRDGNPDVEREFTELVLVVKAGKQGADIKRAFVDYVADGDPYRLVINWRMIACGEVIEARDPSPTGDCSADRHNYE